MSNFEAGQPLYNEFISIDMSSFVIFLTENFKMYKFLSKFLYAKFCLHIFEICVCFIKLMRPN